MDSTDNIKGLSGCGPVNAKKLFAKGNGRPYLDIVFEAFTDQHGDYYGEIIFRETMDALQLLNSWHRLYNQYSHGCLDSSIECIVEEGIKPVPQTPTDEEVLDSTMISQFGWDKLNE